MSTPNLGSVITNATIRKTVYTAYVVALVIVGALQVAYASTETAAPEWLTISLAVLAYLGVPVGGLALVNTGTTPAVSNSFVTIDGLASNAVTQQAVATAVADAMERNRTASTKRVSE